MRMFVNPNVLLDSGTVSTIRVRKWKESLPWDPRVTPNSSSWRYGATEVSQTSRAHFFLSYLAIVCCAYRIGVSLRASAVAQYNIVTGMLPTEIYFRLIALSFDFLPEAHQAILSQTNFWQFACSRISWSSSGLNYRFRDFSTPPWGWDKPHPEKILLPSWKITSYFHPEGGIQKTFSPPHFLFYSLLIN